MINRIEQPKLLVVEGVSEVHVFSALLRTMNLTGVQIVNAKSKDNIRNSLSAIKLHTAFDTVTSIGIVRDADCNSRSAFQSVQSSLNSLGLPVPSRPLQTAGSELRTVILVLPHGSERGMLEDVCLESVAQDSAMRCVESYIECVLDEVEVQPRNLSKSRVHAFLSSREEADVQLGIAAEKGYWNFDHPAFDPLKNLLRVL